MLAAMDIFVLTSTSVETFSNATLEAMAMGRPVLISELGGAREMVGDADCLYPPGNIEKLARMLETLVLSHDKRVQMGIHARQRVENKYSQVDMVNKYSNFMSS